MSAILKFRHGQAEFIRGTERHGVCAFLARRQYGKTTTFAGLALRKMMRKRDHTVVFGSAKLTLAREIVRKESEIIRKAIMALQATADEAQGMLATVDAKTGRAADKLNDDDWAEVFESQRLEFRFFHDRLSYSRTKVIALTPDSVGETGDLMCDELRAIRNWRDVWEAVEPIVSSNPEFRITLSTTWPTDDTHYACEQLAWPVQTSFDPPAPEGHWYRSELGIHVLRVSAADAWADGVPVYDLETREPLAPEEHRRRSHDKDAWDRNYGCLNVAGGTAAVALQPLQSAQTRGVGRCGFTVVYEDTDLHAGIDQMSSRLGTGRVGLGLDLATTEKQTSNPSAFTVMEEDQGYPVATHTWVWKTRDPSVARARVRAIIEAVNDRPAGGRARRLCIDATNERYFAVDLQRELSHLVPCELVVSSETVELPGEPNPITLKAMLGNQWADQIDQNRPAISPDRYIKEDFRRVKKDRGSFDCEMGPNGEHGDTFDSHKLAFHALTSVGGALESTDGIRWSRSGLQRPVYRPRRVTA